MLVWQDWVGQGWLTGTPTPSIYSITVGTWVSGLENA